jgi:peptide/nickel transport system substrate-binding protein
MITNQGMNRRMFWSFVQALLLTLLSLTLGACASSKPAATQELAAVLTLGIRPIGQTDPAFIAADSEVLVAAHVYDYLVDIDPENSVQPRLAVDWEIKDEGTTYVFTLAENVTFHDGSPLTASDVVWTFDRLRDPDVGAPTVSLYSNISSIEATGDHEVTFNLDAPNPFFLHDLSDNHALILKKGTQDPAQAFNGTGPFKVVSYELEDRIILEANQSYYKEGQPRLDGMEILFFSDEAAAADALRSGQVDFIMRLSTPLFENLSQAPSLEALEVSTNGFPAIRLRTDTVPGDDPRVLQAMKLALDRESLFDVVQGGHGVVGEDHPVGPAYPTYHDEQVGAPEQDLDRARSLLANAGYPDGLDLTLNLPDFGNFPELAVVLKEQWSEIGVQVDVQIQPESVYYAEGGPWMTVDFGITGWGHRPYPQFYLDLMLTCDAKWNETRFCNEAFDRLVDVAGSSLDLEERTQAYSEIQRLLVERGPIIIPYFFSQNAVVRDRVVGLKLKPFPGRTDFREVRMER